MISMLCPYLELLPVLENPAADMMEEDGHGGQGAERAPLASAEGMEESPMQLSGTEVEITRGKEFKVG
jgi:hypothetical protein